MNGDSHSIVIANEHLELEVAPELGGKVVALRCRHHGRQWLAERIEQLERAADDPAYGPVEAWGWDELFPSVLPGSVTPAPWPDPLRDHGELWGRQWRTLEATETSLGLRFDCEDPGFSFERRLALDGRRLRCRYLLRSNGTDELPFQWSMHPILALRPGERIEIAGVDSVRATGTGHHLLPDGPAVLDWPDHGGLDLGAVRASDGETILKLYAEAPADAVLAIRGEPCELRVRTDSGFAPHFGIYLNFGGWPAGGPLHHVGIEPTNAPEDDLGAALAKGSAGRLGPGETLGWEIELELGEGCDGAPG